MGSKGKRGKRNVSNCAGWNYSTHPTNRTLTNVTAYEGTPEQITLALCPDCLVHFRQTQQEAAAARQSLLEYKEAPKDEASSR